MKNTHLNEGFSEIHIILTLFKKKYVNNIHRPSKCSY